MKAVAFANNNTILLCWIYPQVIADCLGFSIRRIDISTGKKEALPSQLPFEGQDNPQWQAQTTDIWPIQKFSWNDFTGESGKTYQYEIVPMCGAPDKLTAREDLAALTNQVTLTKEYPGDISLAFTNGILSTQWLARQLPKAADGSPDWQELVKAINMPGHPIREKLSGGVIQLLTQPMLTAKSQGGRVCAAIYELSDPQMVDLWVQNAGLLSVILGNAGKDDETNRDARARLKAAGADVIDRLLPDTQIAHNKLQVLKDAQSKPVSVTTGGTNLTPTGLCAQSNSVITLRSPALADIYAQYLDRLRADGVAQSPGLRAANATRLPEVVLSDGKTRVQAWFSPNMPERLKPQHNAATPPDMQEVFQLMEGVKQMYAFLAFFPGFPSIISKTQEISSKRPELWIRGAVSSPQALPRGAELFHRTGQPPVIVPAAAIEEPFGDYIKELLKAGPDAHAIIHNKLMVGDVFAPDEKDCWMVICSHNLGFKASYQNDENLLIIKGNRAICLAAFVHIMDVYNHYRFRWLLSQHQSGFSGYLSTSPDWQNKYQLAEMRNELEMMTGLSQP